MSKQPGTQQDQGGEKGAQEAKKQRNEGAAPNPPPQAESSGPSNQAQDPQPQDKPAVPTPVAQRSRTDSTSNDSGTQMNSSIFDFGSAFSGSNNMITFGNSAPAPVAAPVPDQPVGSPSSKVEAPTDLSEPPAPTSSEQPALSEAIPENLNCFDAANKLMMLWPDKPVVAQNWTDFKTIKIGAATYLVLDNPGVGDCLFQSISDCLHHTRPDLTHTLLRDRVCGYMSGRLTDSAFTEQVAEQWDKDRFQSLTDHVDQMATPRKPGTGLELMCLTKIFPINLYIYTAKRSENNTPEVSETCTQFLSGPNGTDVKILHCNGFDPFGDHPNHYVGLIPANNEFVTESLLANPIQTPYSSAKIESPPSAPQLSAGLSPIHETKPAQLENNPFFLWLTRPAPAGIPDPPEPPQPSISVACSKANLVPKQISDRFGFMLTDYLTSSSIDPLSIPEVQTTQENCLLKQENRRLNEACCFMEQKLAINPSTERDAIFYARVDRDMWKQWCEYYQLCRKTEEIQVPRLLSLCEQKDKALDMYESHRSGISAKNLTRQNSLAQCIQTLENKLKRSEDDMALKDTLLKQKMSSEGKGLVLQDEAVDRYVLTSRLSDSREECNSLKAEREVLTEQNAALSREVAELRSSKPFSLVEWLGSLWIRLFSKKRPAEDGDASAPKRQRTSQRR